MGMQCHFNVKEVPGFSDAPMMAYNCETESYSYKMPDWSDWHVSCDIDGNAWFDVGSGNMAIMTTIDWLIANRVCFNCS